MPVYCYQSEATGQIIERVYPIGKAPKLLRMKTGIAKRSFAAESKSFPPTKGWPMTCIASGVHASQAKELERHLADAGVPTQVTRDGDPIYRDAKHRRKALKARGLVDKSSYI